MGFVRPEVSDVFLSYATVDDAVTPPADLGWVSTLKDWVEKRLRMLVGREVAVWMDPRLSGNEPLTPQLRRAVRESTAFLIIGSPGYLASSWCAMERDEFVRAHGSSDRLFLVEREPLAIESKPRELRDLRGYRFWEDDGNGRLRQYGFPFLSKDETEYFLIAEDLCRQLSSVLKRAKSSTETLPPPPSGPRVYLAEVTDDLEARRADFQRYLEQGGAIVLPRKTYPSAAADFRAAVNDDLDQCSLFVQLLGEVRGRRPADMPQGYARAQHELALSLQKPVMQWRPHELDLKLIEDREHREFLSGFTVRAEGIEDFKRAVRDALARSTTRAPEVNRFVFVDSESRDREFAQMLCDAIGRFGSDCAQPVTSQDPAKNRLDLEENVRACDVVFLVYGATEVTWVRSRLREVRKILTTRETPIQKLFVVEAPPEPKDSLNMTLKGLRFFDCKAGFKASALEELLGAE